jgi:hypothetical protein
MSWQEFGEDSPNILPRLFIGHRGCIEKEVLSPEKREQKIKTLVMKDMLDLAEPETLKKEIKHKIINTTMSN